MITFLNPAITELALLYVIAFWAVATGVFEIVAAVRLRRYIEGEWLLALSGVLSILFGVALVIMPMAGLLAVAWLVGFYAVFFGVLQLALGFELRRWARREPVLTSPRAV